MNLKRTLLVAAALALPLSATETASAQCAGGLATCGGYGYPGYFDIGRLYSTLKRNVPHFAAFPPVYYSYPVPRTYGYSPFAYPPGHVTPEVAAPTPLAIDNPYYQGKEVNLTDDSDAAADQTTQTTTPVEPLVISNPFVASADNASLQAAVAN